MNTILVGIAAQYQHTCLAVRALGEYACTQGETVTWREYTVNQPTRQILEEIMAQSPDLLAFSCYLWNLQTVLRLAEEFSRLCPTTPILLGGPEVSFDAPDLLAQYPFLTYILTGEGELPFTALVAALRQGESTAPIPALCQRLEGAIVLNPPPPPFLLDKLPFLYPDLPTLAHRILYYEASRGCPFGCRYCLSSLDRVLRFRSLPLVQADLQRFLDAKVPQVKFVDRTFNANPAFSRGIWQFLLEQDNGVSNFHFEIAADLLEEEDLALLTAARPGLFQLEIGVQSTNPQTLRAIDRVGNQKKLFANVEKLRQKQGLHLHLDLIAGLPYEDYSTFGRSFDAVFALAPHQLQLGFLKLLKGSFLHQSQGELGLICSPLPPYEVLSTPWLSFAQLTALKRTEEVFEIYQGSHRFTQTLGWMLSQAPSPFGFFASLGAYWQAEGHHLTPHSKERLHSILRDFWVSTHGDHPLLPLLCRLDILLHEPPRKFPPHADLPIAKTQRAQIVAALTPEVVACHLPHYTHEEAKNLPRLLSAEIFSNTFLSPTNPSGETLYLFDYRNRDDLGRAIVTKIFLPPLPPQSGL